jgi:hypothetical protein
MKRPKGPKEPEPNGRGEKEGIQSSHPLWPIDSRLSQWGACKSSKHLVSQEKKSFAHQFSIGCSKPSLPGEDQSPWLFVEEMNLGRE